jgi:hypothetical protein
MLKAAASTLAKRSIQRSSNGAASGMAPQRMTFHGSARREDDAAAKSETSSELADKGGFMGTGFSHLYAIPAGVAFAVPILEFEWYIVNEETLLASTFLAFCVVAYSQGGDVINKALRDESKSMLKLQNDAEDQVIAKLEDNLQYMKITENIVSDYQDALDLTTDSYAKLNAAGKIKPQHDLKAQMEKMLTMVANEEKNVYEKAKMTLMTDATASVTAEFATNEPLKKAALDAALAKLTGKSKPGSDPVQQAYVKYFKTKAAEAKKADDGSEEKAQRVAMLAKLNALADNEGMFFNFDPAGNPKLVTE